MENNDIFRIIKKPGYQICIIQGVEGLKPENDVDVEVEFNSGQKLVATFFTMEKVYQLFQHFKLSGECKNGLYLWATDMILVESLTEDVIVATIEDLISSGEIEMALTDITGGDE